MNKDFMKALYSTIVAMPDNSNLHVDYYCSDAKLNETEKENKTQLFIQLEDCICSVKIEKSICENVLLLEKIVHNKIINTKGHLC